MALTTYGPQPRRNGRPTDDRPSDASAATMQPPPDVAVTPCDAEWPRPYTFDNGLRRVKPYYFTYNTNCKQRWRNRELLEICADEFRDRPYEYYKESIEKGRIVVNGKQVPTNYIVRNGDLMSHTTHRHEPPVTADPIGVVHETDDMIIINKPAGVPVHPAGRYMYNSLVEIMRAERHFSFKPLPCHRLDRLTSGVMFIAKHPKAADELSKQIKGRTVKKEYVARVAGEFPAGDVVCDKPILQISPKLGLNRVRASGKDARTVFRRLAYYPPKDDDGAAAPTTGTEDEVDGQPWKKLRGYSIVRCMPLTGRTHQIRVHLQFLGHPISNDPIYANQRVFGPSLAGGDDCSDDDASIMTRLARMGKDEVASAVAYHDELVGNYRARQAEKLTGERCPVCDTPLYSDPGVHELGIYLHARKYACEEGRWSYETPLPAWALPPEGYDGPTEATGESDPLAADLLRLGLNEDGSVREEGEGEGEGGDGGVEVEQKHSEVQLPVQEQDPAIAVAAATAAH